MRTMSNQRHLEVIGSSSRAFDPSQEVAPSNDVNVGFAINHRLSLFNPYFPPFSEQADLSASLIDYQYPPLEQSMNFGYMLAGFTETDVPLPDASRPDERPLTLPSSLQDSTARFATIPSESN